MDVETAAHTLATGCVGEGNAIEQWVQGRMADLYHFAFDAGLDPERCFRIARSRVVYQLEHEHGGQ